MKKYVRCVTLHPECKPVDLHLCNALASSKDRVPWRLLGSLPHLARHVITKILNMKRAGVAIVNVLPEILVMPDSGSAGEVEALVSSPLEVRRMTGRYSALIRGLRQYFSNLSSP